MAGRDGPSSPITIEVRREREARHVSRLAAAVGQGLLIDLTLNNGYTLSKKESRLM